MLQALSHPQELLTNFPLPQAVETVAEPTMLTDFVTSMSPEGVRKMSLFTIPDN